MEAASLRVPIAEFWREYKFAASISPGDLRLGFALGLPLFSDNEVSSPLPKTLTHAGSLESSEPRAVTMKL
jgi:hypothetical protein